MLLLRLIATFPTTNPTPTTTPGKATVEEEIVVQVEDKSAAEPDLSNLMSSIRARYRLLCTSVNVRPRLVASDKLGMDAANDQDDSSNSGVVEGIEGPMKGVDTRQLRF